MIDKRKEFTTEEWIAMLLRSEGMEPDALSEKEKLHFIERMVPLAEHNYNLCELGPRGTARAICIKRFRRIHSDERRTDDHGESVLLQVGAQSRVGRALGLRGV